MEALLLPVPRASSSALWRNTRWEIFISEQKTCCIVQVGGDGQWIAMPSLAKARCTSIGRQNMIILRLHWPNCLIRSKHGCAVITDGAGRTGILVVGGTGDEVSRMLSSCSLSSCRPASLALQSSWTWPPWLRGSPCLTLGRRGAAGHRSTLQCT